MKTAFLFLLILIGMLPAAAAAQPSAPAAAPAGQPRQLFLVLYRPGPNWVAGRPMREQDLRAHGSYYAGLLRDGRAFAGGGYVGEDGGMAILRAADIEEARAILAADPAILNGVFVAALRQWAPRFHSSSPLMEMAR